MSSIGPSEPGDGFPASSFKYGPLLHLRTLLTAFLQGLFQEAPIGTFHWDDGPTSEIVITGEGAIHLDKLNSRPAITVTRGPIQFQSLGLDDMDKYDPTTDSKQKTVHASGSFSINCSSRSDLESEQLAWVVWEMTWLLRDRLMKSGFFEIGRQMVLGAPTSAENIILGDGGAEWFTTTVFCPFQLGRTSKFTPLGKKILQSIDFNLTVARDRVRHQGAITQGNSADLPVHIQAIRPPGYAPSASDVFGGTPNPGAAPPTLVPHPLNPSKMVTVRAVRGASPNKLSWTPPGAAVVPIQSSSVEESTPVVTDPVPFKV